MYHYVRKFDEKHPYFRFLDIENFKKQLDFFENNFGFVKYVEWLDFVKNGVMPNIKGKIILTFDDALKCHYEYVYPELVRRGLWGIFYVPTQPYTTGKLLDVHLIHLLCGSFNGSDLLKFLLSIVSDEMIMDSKREEFRTETYKSQENYKGVEEFKRILNYFVDYNYRDYLITAVAAKFGYKFIASNFYVTDKNLKKMSDNGMIIGSHTVNHPVMSKIRIEDQKKQITESFRYLDSLGVITSKTYCHPYGGFHTFDKNTLSILNDHAIEFSFNVEPREITALDIKSSKQHLPRFDCNQYPFGLAS